MFLKRLSAALVGIVCFGSIAVGAENFTQTNATNSGKGNPLVAPLGVSFGLNPIAPECNGDNNGSLEVIITSGVAPFTYRLQKNNGALGPNVVNTSSTFIIPNLSAGTYKVYMTDGEGTTSDQTQTIFDNPILSVALESSVVSPQCSGGTANIYFEASGGSGSGYAYNLYRNGTPDGSNLTGDFTGKGEGNYFVTVTDSRNCTKNSSVTVQVNVPDPINFNHNIINEVNCDNSFATVQFFNLPTDQFDIEVRNTTLGKTYTSHTADFIYSNLEAGSYSVIVTRSSCPTDTETLTFTLDPFSPITVSTTPNSPIELSCGGINDLKDVSVTINGGRTGRQVKVVMDDNNEATVNQEGTVSYGTPVSFTGLAAGSYTIKWNDSENLSCSGTQSYVISNPSSPIEWLNDPIGIATNCNGDDTGVIQINVNGGTTPYTYYVDGIANPSPINKPAGTYTVYAEDSKGCITEDRTVIITQPDPVVATHNPADDVHLTCPIGNDGEIHMNVTGGVGAYKYDLIYSSTSVAFRSNIPTSDVISIGSLSGNTYNVQVKDENNCPANLISDISINEPEEITLSEFNLSPIKCYGDSAQLVVQAVGGSSSLMTYELFIGNQLIDRQETSGVVNFNGLKSSDYLLKVWSDPSCPYILKRFNVPNKKELVVTNVDDSIMMRCPGDVPTYLLNVDGEEPFSYSVGSLVDVPFGVGNKSVLINSGLFARADGYLNKITIKDGNGCEKEYDIVIYEPNQITVKDIESDPVKCKNSNNGHLYFTIEGGTPRYTINYTNTATSITKTKFSSNGNVAIETLAAGTYNFVITDKNLCTTSTPMPIIEIGEPELFQIEGPVYDPILCFGESTSVNISATGGWVDDKNITIKGQGITTTISSGTNYDLKAGSYTLTAINGDGCKASSILNISQPDKLVLTLGDVDNVSCFGQDDAVIRFSVKGGVLDYHYDLIGDVSQADDFSGLNDSIVGGILEGTYQLKVRDANLCESNIQSVTITEPLFVEFDYRVDSLSCYESSDGKITFLNARGGNDNSYLAFINGTATTFPVITGLDAGTYDIQITDSKGCPSGIETLTIGQPDVIILNDAYISDSITCHNLQNGAITVEAEGGGPFNYLMYRVAGPIVRTYQVSNEFKNLPFGEYEVWVRNNEKNCAVKFPTNLIIVNPQEITVSSVDVTDVKCHNEENGLVKINATGGTGLLKYSLPGAAPSIPDNPNNTGYFEDLGDPNKTFTTYNYIIEDDNLCELRGTFTVNNPDELTISENDHFQVSCNDKKDGWIKVNVAGGNGGYTFKKDVSSVSVTNDVEKITDNIYKINKYDGGFFLPLVIDAKGCVDSITDEIEIINPELFLISSVDWGKKLCNGDMDDSTIIHVEGGTKGFYYSLDGGETYSELDDSIFVGEKIGKKEAIAKDANGCLTPMEDPFMMTEPVLFSVNYDFTGLSCYYDDYGDMTLKIKGGTAPYKLSLNDNQFINDTWTITKDPIEDTTVVKLSEQGINLYTDRTYQFYMKDANECHIQNIPGLRENYEPFADTLFLKPDSILLTGLTSKPIKCGNDKTGVIQFTAKIGNKDFVNDIPAGYVFTVTNKEENRFSYAKSNDPGMTIVTGLYAGKHSAELVDKYGCKAATKLTDFTYDPNSLYWGIDTISVYATYDSISVSIESIKKPKCDFWYDGYIQINAVNFRGDGIIYTVERWDSSEVRFNMEERNWTDTILADRGKLVEPVTIDTLFYEKEQRIVEDIGIGLYRITVRDVYTECEAVIDTLIFSVDRDSCPPINYYNAFTPLNNDGDHDQWEIFGSQYQSYTLQIYTALGELIYSDEGVSGNKGIKWNGLDKWGRPAPVGTYIYLLKKFEGTEKEVLIDGNVTILRSNGR